MRSMRAKIIVSLVTGLVAFGLDGCTTSVTIGAVADGTGDTGTSSGDSSDGVGEQADDTVDGTGTGPALETGTGSAAVADTETDSASEGFTRVFLELTFDESDDDMDWYDEPEWTWNSAEGTFDLDVEFTRSPDWRTIEYWVGENIWPGGADWTGAVVAEFRVQVLETDGGFLRIFVQSIEEESEIEERWLWYTGNYDLVAGDWVALTLDLREAPITRLNLQEFTKIGFQVHAPSADPPAGDTDTQYALDAPARSVVRVDHIIVRGY